MNMDALRRVLLRKGWISMDLCFFLPSLRLLRWKRFSIYNISHTRAFVSLPVCVWCALVCDPEIWPWKIYCLFIFIFSLWARAFGESSLCFWGGLAIYCFLLVRGSLLNDALQDEICRTQLKNWFLLVTRPFCNSLMPTNSLLMSFALSLNRNETFRT